MRFMRYSFGLLMSVCCSATLAADWDGIPVPVDPGSGKQWQLQEGGSDRFNYTAPPTNKPSQFTNKWKDTFINAWLGPGLTEYNPGHSYTTGGMLGIDTSRKPGTNRVFAGIISSKQAFSYPLYLEARVKIMDMVLANAVWMLSADSTQEIDAMEGYGSCEQGREWFCQRMHVSHHVFIRNPFQDYQPNDGGGWVFSDTPWKNDFHRYGVYWRDPWHLEYYIDGVKVRTRSGPSQIDPLGHTGGQGLNKPEHIIIDAEDQDWISDQGIVASDADLANQDKSIMWVDWIRTYKPVDGGGNSGGGNSGGGNNGGGGSNGGTITPPSGVTSLQLRHSNKCMDLQAGSSANGANIHQWGCNGNNTNQDFNLVSAGGGYYEVRTKHNKCLGIAGGSNDNGTNAIQWDCVGAFDQQYRLEDRGNGWFSLVARHSNKCVDVSARSSNNGANIHQWQCISNANNQQFRFR